MPKDSSHNKRKSYGFSEKVADLVYESGAPYRATVSYFSKLLRPFLDRIEEDYIKEAIQRNHAENDPQLKEILASEIRKRPDAHGRILDVIDTIPRTIIRSVAAVALAVTGNIIDRKVHNKEARIFKWVGIGSAVALIGNQAVELFRSVYRFMAAFEGSEAAALKKYGELSETSKAPDVPTGKSDGLLAQQPGMSPRKGKEVTSFSSQVPGKPITPESIARQKTEFGSKKEII